MTLEEIKNQMRKIEEENQNKYIDTLYNLVCNLAEKINNKSYKGTSYEYIKIEAILNILNDIKKNL